MIESAGYVAHPEALPQRARPAHRDGARSRSATSAGPERLVTHDETGEFPVVVKSGNRLVEMVMAHHPFDVVGLGRLLLPVGVQHPRLRAAGGPRAPAAAGAPDVRGRRLRGLLVLPAAVRLRPGRGARALQPPERDVGRGALLRERRVHEPQGHRVRLDHAAPRRAAARAAARADRGSRSGRRARTSSRSWSTPSGRCS